MERFFGPNRDQLLTVEKFRQFHEELRMEVLKLEVHVLPSHIHIITVSSLTPSHRHTVTHSQFNRFEPEDGVISEYHFARLILSYAEMNDQRRKKFFKRIRRVYGKELSEESSKVSVLSVGMVTLVYYVMIV